MPAGAVDRADEVRRAQGSVQCRRRAPAATVSFAAVAAGGNDAEDAVEPGPRY